MDNFFANSFLEPYHFFRLTLIFFIIVFLRYLIVSGLYHYAFYVWFRPKVAHRILNLKPKERKQVQMEIRRSALTSIIFAFSATILLVLWQNGYTHITTDHSLYPWWYHPISLFLALFIHETYYYWLHRWMHQPKIYRKVHKWHHDSIETSSLTSFSFHPTESILQAIVVPVLVLFLPMHLYTLFVLLFIMTISGTINHAGVEIFPKWFLYNPIGKWFIGATHHDLHHKQFRFNYGLYFTFWDRWMGTESPDYQENFKRKTNAGLTNANADKRRTY